MQFQLLYFVVEMLPSHCFVVCNLFYGSQMCIKGFFFFSESVFVITKALREFMVFLYRSLVGEKAMNRLENKKLFPK